MPKLVYTITVIFFSIFISLFSASGLAFNITIETNGFGISPDPHAYYHDDHEWRHRYHHDDYPRYHRPRHHRPHPYIGSRTFDYPMIGGMLLDWCLSQGWRCGEEPAQQFCQDKGFSGVIDFQPQRSLQTTRYIDSGELCGGQCTAFRYIRCR